MHLLFLFIFTLFCVHIGLSYIINHFCILFMFVSLCSSSYEYRKKISICRLPQDKASTLVYGGLPRFMLIMGMGGEWWRVLGVDSEWA